MTIPKIRTEELNALFPLGEHAQKKGPEKSKQHHEMKPLSNVVLGIGDGAPKLLHRPRNAFIMNNATVRIIAACSFTFILTTALFTTHPQLAHNLRQQTSVTNGGPIRATLTNGTITALLTRLQDMRQYNSELAGTAAFGAVASPKCAYPIVYNKPPKTASTLVKRQLTTWAKAHKRKVYNCGIRPLESAVRFHECVPRTDDGCGVLNCHIVLDDTIERLVGERLPKYRAITTTRYAPHRVISHYMQQMGKDMTKGGAENAMDISSGLAEFLRERYNPGELYTWHFGERRQVGCPISDDEAKTIFNMVAKYFIVIDANLPAESNAILKDAGLFQFPEDGKVYNERGAASVVLNATTKELLFNVTCYERVMHRALQARMAVLYEKATGVECLRSERLDKFSSCLEDRERKYLGDTWLF